MRYAILENNIVTNTILCEESFALENFPDAIQSDTAGIGDTYSEGVFIKPVILPVAPERVTPRQMRLAMLAAGILHTVETAVNASGNEAAKIAWDYAIQIDRQDPMLNAMAPMLGLTQQQIDQLFITAESL